ncbi:protein FANTASTIC FOUR 3 [Sesamum alatum]|uniref:Protein FANTASTIC FOUR 3 n=1 Tax=Sesamum alatum TaxID=300844 RepID=A0AAE1YP21_9LAMI|nr:protein FANTASTIC FOUR 3 [Sesamum alatum]
MSTIVTQNLVSCSESQLTETTTVLQLKLAAPPPSSTSELCGKQGTDDHLQAEVGFGNWGFIQTASKDRNSSFSRLSAKSLQLCTENLGSETGTDSLSPNTIAISFCPSSSCENSSTHKRPQLQKSKQETKSFPPPLTTSSLKMRRSREGGRLIIEAAELAPGRSRCWQAERSGGRLRLCLLTGSDSEATTTSCGGEEVAAEGKMVEPGSDGEVGREEFGGEMKMEKVEMMSRCKQLCRNWEPSLWVATL